jgi:localization factor PodJL
MRAELPWNVAGIPPEAREAARAAARREGLSVGEWLTRRILRSFSGMEEDLPSGGYESRAPTGAPLDSWGLPPSAAARRDTEEMMARVGRSEVESNDAWRRIEDQMRGLSRRLDSSERSHSESNRIVSRTAQEMNISAREQAQAFDQLGLNVMALNERLERLERSAANDGIKEAVKALHQGLSRLADQISATATHSAGQATQLTANLEQLAGRVGQARVDAEEANKALDQRIATAEKTTQFNTNALDHALEKLEASAGQRATDQVEGQRRHLQAEESINRLEDAIARLEMRLPDAAFERRLDGIEQSVSGIAQRMDEFDPAARFNEQMQAISHRLESLEKDHTDLAAETRNRFRSPEPPAYEAPKTAAPPYEPPAYAAEPPPAFEPPSFQQEGPPSAFAAYETQEAFAPNQAAPGTAVPATPGGFAFELPPDQTDPFAPPTEFGPEFNEVFAEPENFLTAARRSARAASEKAESERRGRFAGFRWGKDEAAAEGEEKEKRRYVVPAILALLVVLAVAAGLVLMRQQPKPADQQFPAKPAAQGGPTFSVPEPPDGDDTQFVVAPQAGGEASNQGGNPDDYTTQRSEPVPPRTAMPLQQRDVREAPVNRVPDGGARGVSGAQGGERVIALANQGNPVALTILGLRALDGTGGQAVNLPNAVKFLTQAAQKGQAVAQYRLGTLYERGQGVPADGAQAAHWYEMAANQGNRKAMHNLAVAYAGGIGGKKNMAEAARWFAKAAALGLSDSQFNLAVLYERGDGVPQSLLDAYKWYSIAAATGDSESKQRIAVLQTQLSDSDKAAANKSAATFHAAPLNRSANVPPEPADLGGQ